MYNTHCNEIQSLLPDWIKNKESDEHNQEILLHLSHCDGCKQETMELEQTLTQMKQQYTSPPQQYFITLLPRVHQRIEKKRKQNVYWRTAQAITSLAAIAIVFIFGSLFKTSEKSFDEKLQSITRDINETDLQDFASLDLTEEYLSPAQQEETIFSDDDIEVLQTLVDEHPPLLFTGASALENDEKILLETLSDEDAQFLVSTLEKKFPDNYNRKK